MPLVFIPGSGWGRPSSSASSCFNGAFGKLQDVKLSTKITVDSSTGEVIVSWDKGSVGGSCPMTGPDWKKNWDQTDQ